MVLTRASLSEKIILNNDRPNLFPESLSRTHAVHWAQEI